MIWINWISGNVCKVDLNYCICSTKLTSKHAHIQTIYTCLIKRRSGNWWLLLIVECELNVKLKLCYISKFNDNTCIAFSN